MLWLAVHSLLTCPLQYLNLYPDCHPVQSAGSFSDGADIGNSCGIQVTELLWQRFCKPYLGVLAGVLSSRVIHCHSLQPKLALQSGEYLAASQHRGRMATCWLLPA